LSINRGSALTKLPANQSIFHIYHRKITHQFISKGDWPIFSKNTKFYFKS